MSEQNKAEDQPVVSIAKIKNDNISFAVEEAIDLLGGIGKITEGKNRIMLKPNLVADSPDCTTKPEVIKPLVRLMKNAGKEVSIGEGSAAAGSFNHLEGIAYRTGDKDTLDRMQQHVFDVLGYTELAESMNIPLINLHSGQMMDVEVPGGFAYQKITLHHSLTDIDLLCSVPMMKTHIFAGVTLGMKNLIGLYSGTVYQSVRSLVHEAGAKVEPSGTAAVIVDMVRANKLGLVVVDGSMAMEGDGPVGGPLVKMDLIIAGTDPLATDIVTAKIMGFEPEEIPTFLWAEKAGMKKVSLGKIEIRGEELDKVRRRFVRPNIVTWADTGDWGRHELGRQ